MGVERYGRVLLLFKIRELYKEGLGELFSELGSEVVVLNAVLL